MCLCCGSLHILILLWSPWQKKGSDTVPLTQRHLCCPEQQHHCIKCKQKQRANKHNSKHRHNSLWVLFLPAVLPVFCGWIVRLMSPCYSSLFLHLVLSLVPVDLSWFRLVIFCKCHVRGSSSFTAESQWILVLVKPDNRRISWVMKLRPDLCGPKQTRLEP